MADITAEQITTKQPGDVITATDFNAIVEACAASMRNGSTNGFRYSGGFYSSQTKTPEGYIEDPAIILPGTGSLSTPVIKTDGWDVDNAPKGSEGVVIPVSRVVWNGTNGTLVGYARTLTFDSTGKLGSITAETQFTIAETEECEDETVAHTDTSNTFTQPQTVHNAAASQIATFGGASHAQFQTGGNVVSTINPQGQYSFTGGGSSQAALTFSGDNAASNRTATRDELGLGAAATLGVTTSVGDPGSDSLLPTEQAVRTALASAGGGGTAAVTLSGTISAGQIMQAVGTTGAMQTTGSTLAEILASAGGSSAVWGSITGTLANQTDLAGQLAGLVPFTGATSDINLGTHKITSGTNSSGINFSLDPQDGYGKFNVTLYKGEVQTNSRRDCVMLLGWNQTSGGASENASEIDFYDGWESNFYNPSGSNAQIERYQRIILPDTSTLEAGGWTYDVDNDILNHTLKADNFSICSPRSPTYKNFAFNDLDTGSPVLNIGANQVYLSSTSSANLPSGVWFDHSSTSSAYIHFDHIYLQNKELTKTRFETHGGGYGTIYYTANDVIFRNDSEYEAMRISGWGSDSWVKIGTTDGTFKTTINEQNGQCLQLAYNTPSGYASVYSNFIVTSDGHLQIVPSGSVVEFGTASLTLTGNIGQSTAPVGNLYASTITWNGSAINSAATCAASVFASSTHTHSNYAGTSLATSSSAGLGYGDGSGGIKSTSGLYSLDYQTVGTATIADSDQLLIYSAASSAVKTITMSDLKAYCGSGGGAPTSASYWLSGTCAGLANAIIPTGSNGINVSADGVISLNVASIYYDDLAVMQSDSPLTPDYDGLGLMVLAAAKQTSIDDIIIYGR